MRILASNVLLPSVHDSDNYAYVWRLEVLQCALFERFRGIQKKERQRRNLDF